MPPQLKQLVVHIDDPTVHRVTELYDRLHDSRVVTRVMSLEDAREKHDALEGSGAPRSEHLDAPAALLAKLRQELTDVPEADWTSVERWEMQRLQGLIGMIGMIDAHDRCLFTGHGSPVGQLGDVDDGELIVYEDMAAVLRDKRHSIYDWCHSAQFMKEHRLSGYGYERFYLGGSWESAEEECDMVGVDVTEEQYDRSETAYNVVLASCIEDDLSPLDTLRRVAKAYAELAELPIVAYNLRSLRASEDGETFFKLSDSFETLVEEERERRR